MQIAPLVRGFVLLRRVVFFVYLEIMSKRYRHMPLVIQDFASNYGLGADILRNSSHFWEISQELDVV